MTNEYRDRIRAVSIAKALTVAGYGESVAAYRYRTLAEKTRDEAQRRVFTQIAEEEQGHHQAVSELLNQRFPGSDFLLTAADKDLVIVGPRMLDLSEDPDLSKAMTMIVASERRTGEFYAVLADVTEQADLRPIFRAMAHECFDHAKQLESLTLSD